MQCQWFFLQELFNANEENLDQILEEGWLLYWVERARDEIHPLGSIPEFCLQKLFILFSSSALLPLAIQLLILAMRVTCITLPDFPLQCRWSSQTTPPLQIECFRLLAGGGGLAWRLFSTWASSRFSPFSNQFQPCHRCPGDDWGNG